jgi:lysophospholipase L1-like esterase
VLLLWTLLSAVVLGGCTTSVADTPDAVTPGSGSTVPTASAPPTTSTPTSTSSAATTTPTTPPEPTSTPATTPTTPTTSTTSSATTTSTTSSATSSTTASWPASLVALGDSVPAADTCDCTGFVERLGPQLQAATHRAWSVHNDAVSGYTSGDVLDDLQDPDVQRDLSTADLVVVQVGANDLDLDQVGDPDCDPVATSDCYTQTLDQLEGTLGRIVDGIRSLDQRPDLQIALLGYWNVTVDGQVAAAQGSAFVKASVALTEATNAVISGVADRSGSIYVDTRTPFDGASGTRDATDDLLDDGDHPDGSGHALLATAVMEALQRSGAVDDWTRS